MPTPDLINHPLWFPFSESLGTLGHSPPKGKTAKGKLSLALFWGCRAKVDGSILRRFSHLYWSKENCAIYQLGVPLLATDPNKDPRIITIETWYKEVNPPSKE